jgi:hypothetical protein
MSSFYKYNEKYNFYYLRVQQSTWGDIYLKKTSVKILTDVLITIFVDLG